MEDGLYVPLGVELVLGMDRSCNQENIHVNCIEIWYTVALYEYTQ